MLGLLNSPGGPDLNGFTVISSIHRACYYNRQEVVEFMLQFSKHTPLANLNRGDTPIHYACRSCNVELASLLLDHSPRLVLVCDTMMNRSYSPLHVVCMEQGSEQIVKKILQKFLLLLETDEYSEDSPLDMNVRDANGCTPLYYACYYGHDEIVALLLKFGQQHKNCQPFDVTVTTLQKRTPLHAAVQKNHLSVIQIILDHYSNDKTNTSTNELINILGHPSADTKSYLLDCPSFPPPRVSSISSIGSQNSYLTFECSDDAFSIISEDIEIGVEYLLSQKSQWSNSLSFKSKPHTSVHSSKSGTLSSRSNKTNPVMIKSSPTSTSTTSSQQTPSRQQSKIEQSPCSSSGVSSSAGSMSLFLTMDGSFLAYPTKYRLKNINKDFDQLLITPLAEACACGHSQAVDMLLSAGASDPEGMGVRLAQFAKNHEIAYTVLSHHCKLLVENSSLEQPSYTLSIDWSNMKITELTGDLFAGESLFFPSSAEDDDGKVLPMMSLPTRLGAFSLTKVSLNNNNLSLLPVELLQLPNLQLLDVSCNHIQDVPSEITCPSLKYLYLNDNKLIEVPITIWYLPSLEELQLKNNFLASVRKDFIDPSRLSQSLKMVDISHNKLDDLPSFILDLPALAELNVSHNELITLPHNLWECRALRELNASYNALVKLPSCEPQSTLVLLQSHAIPAVQQGRKIVGAKAHLQGNFEGTASKISKSNTAGFVSALETPQEVYSEKYMYHNEGCCGIKKMLLRKNNFYVFPDALPCLAPLLTELDISYNHLEEIDMSFLPPMLRKLVASHNKITKFGTFVNPQLKSLMIQHCRMVGNRDQECHHRIHKDMKNLSIIDLAYNQLKHFQLMQFLELNRSLLRIKQLDSIPALQYSRLDLLYPELENLNISHNHLQGCFNHNIGYQSRLKSITLSDNIELEELPMQFAYFKKRKTFTQLSLHNLPKLRDPPAEYHDKLRPLLSYMSSRLKK